MFSHYRIFISKLKISHTFFFLTISYYCEPWETVIVKVVWGMQGVQGAGELSRKFCGLTLYLAPTHFVEHLPGAHLLSRCRTCKSVLCYQAGATVFLWKSLPLKMYWKNAMIKTAISWVLLCTYYYVKSYGQPSQWHYAVNTIIVAVLLFKKPKLGKVKAV